MDSNSMKIIIIPMITAKLFYSFHYQSANRAEGVQ